MEMLENYKVESTKKRLKKYRERGMDPTARNYRYDFSFLIILVLPLLQLFTQAFIIKMEFSLV